MTNKPPADDPSYAALRDEAEALLHENGGQLAAPVPTDSDLAGLIHELKVHQAELRLQNQQLRQTEVQLQQALSRYETLFHSLPLAAVVVDERGIVQRSNDKAASLLGFRSRSQFEGHSMMRLIAKMDRSRLMVEVRRRSGDPTPVMRRIWIPRDDAGIEVDMHLELLDADYHADHRVLITMVDQTQHYAEQRQMDLLGKVVDDMGARVVAFDRDGRCVYANREMQRATGIDGSEMIGARRSAWMGRQEVKKEEQRDALVYVTKKPVRDLIRQVDRQGVDRVIERVKFPLFDDNHDCIGLGELITDVTDSRRRDRQMQMAMEAYGLSRDGILMTDADNRIVAVNPAFEQLTGYQEDEVRGENPRILSSGRHDRAFYRAMWRDLVNGRWEGEIWNRRKSGEIYPEWLTISALKDGLGRVTNYVAVFTDITARKAAEEEIQHLALYDSLTGLANRQLLADRMGMAIHAAARERGRFAVVFFDLDHFKAINDHHGHDVGDRLLQQVSQRVRRVTRETDTLSRIGGDEFVLLFESGRDDELSLRLEDLLTEINGVYEIDALRVDISASVGVALYPSDGEDFDTLLKHADAAMYKAKEDGRSVIRFYSNALGSRNRRRLDVDAALRDAMPAGEFSLVYQPQVASDDRRPIACEALLRWRSARLGDIPPSEFIPNAERTGMIIPIGAWVMRTAFDVASQLGADRSDFRVAVNLSARQLFAKDFLDAVDAAIATSGVDPAAIELELTESTIMTEVEHAMAVMKALKSRGLSLAIDDFGTGYSSLSYLNGMPVEKLKIDRRFIQNIGRHTRDDQICLSIIGLAESLGVKVVAEGVETEAQLEFLQAAGCDVVQGYLFARPLQQAALPEWLVQNSNGAGFEGAT